MSKETTDKCRELVAKWKRRAARKFEDATHFKRGSDRRALEHSAVCELNIAMELESVIGK